MLAGRQDSGAPMFPGLTDPLKPSTQDMREAYEAVQSNRVVRLTNMQVKTYDLGNEVEAKVYADDLKALMLGLQANTHVLVARDVKFVKGQQPRWIAHLEWAEYELNETPVPRVGESNGDAEKKAGSNST